MNNRDCGRQLVEASFCVLDLAWSAITVELRYSVVDSAEYCVVCGFSQVLCIAVDSAEIPCVVYLIVLLCVIVQ